MEDIRRKKGDQLPLPFPHLIKETSQLQDGAIAVYGSGSGNDPLITLKHHTSVGQLRTEFIVMKDEGTKGLI